MSTTAVESLTMTADQHEYNQIMEGRIRELEGWMRQHDGRITEKWRAQEADNETCRNDRANLRGHIDAKFDAMTKELHKLSIKVATFAGLAAVIGSVGSAAFNYFR